MLLLVHFASWLCDWRCWLCSGGTEITVSGSSLGADAPSDDAVTIGGKTAAILSWSDTDVEVELPALGPGSYPLILTLDHGYADTTYVAP